MKQVIKENDVYFVFINDFEIEVFIKLLKKMKKEKISYARNLGKVCDKTIWFHNGKPSIPDYNKGYERSALLRTD